MSWAPPGPINWGATSRSTFQTVGDKPGLGSQDLATNPNVTALAGHPVAEAIKYLGEPDGITPDQLASLSRDLETVASAYGDTAAKQIAHLVINGSVANIANRHFSILPPVESAYDELSGKGWTVLRLQNSLPDLTPELGRPRFVTHNYESGRMAYDRFAQGMHLPYDFYRTPNGQQLFREQAALIQSNFTILAQITITGALLTCKDAFRKFREYFDGTTMSAWNSMDMHFGRLHRDPKAWYKLADYARRMSTKVGSGGFDMALVSESVFEMVAWGSDFETEYWRRGPKAESNLENGSDNVKLPGGIEPIKEPTYNLDNDGTAEPLNMLSAEVQVGVVGYMNPLDPLCKDTWTYNYLNLDAGNAEIEAQAYEDLLYAALCFDSDGCLDEYCYSKLVEPGAAQAFARSELGIENLAPTDRANDVPLIDPFVATVDGRAEVVRYQGNQEIRHCSYRTQQSIVECALRKLREECDFDSDTRLVRHMLEAANRNYNVAPDNFGDVEGFIWATANANGMADGPGGSSANMDSNYVRPNEWGSPNLPPLIEIDAGARGVAFVIGVDPQHVAYKVPTVSKGSNLGTVEPSEDGTDAMRRHHGGTNTSDHIGAYAMGNVLEVAPVAFDRSGRPIGDDGSDGGNQVRLLGTFPSYAAINASPFYDEGTGVIIATPGRNGRERQTGESEVNTGSQAREDDTEEGRQESRIDEEPVLIPEEEIEGGGEGSSSSSSSSGTTTRSGRTLEAPAFRPRRQAAPTGTAAVSPVTVGNAGAFRAINVAYVKDGSVELGSLDGSLPGFSNMSHMRYLAHAYRTGTAGKWSKIKAYDDMFKTISEGMDALDRITDKIRQCWSLDRSPNLFFDPRNMPYYQIPSDPLVQQLTAFQQDVVQGVRYAVGIQESQVFSVAFVGEGGRLGVVRQGGVPPSDGNVLDALWRVQLNYTLADNTNNGADLGARPPAYRKLQAAAPRNAVGSNGLTYPNSGLEWMDAMGFTAAVGNNKDSGEIGVAVFQSGQLIRGVQGMDRQGLYAQMESDNGTQQWIADYNRSDVSSVVKTGLRASGWNEMSRAVMDELGQHGEWTNGSNKQKGAILARIVSGLDWAVNGSKPGQLQSGWWKNMIRTSVGAVTQRRAVEPDGTGIRDLRVTFQEASERVVKSLYGADAQVESYSPRYINTRLSLAPNYWSLVGDQVASAVGAHAREVGPALSILRPADPDAPNTHWLGLTPDFSIILAHIARNNNKRRDGSTIVGPQELRDIPTFAKDIEHHARGRPAGSYEASMLHPTTRRLAEPPTADGFGAGNKRFRADEFGNSGISHHAGSAFRAPNNIPAAQDDQNNAPWYRAALEHNEPVRGIATMHPLAMAPHFAPVADLLAGTPGYSDFVPNVYWHQRWGNVMSDYRNDMIPRMVHLAFMGLPINAHTFANLARQCIPPPITLLPADPFIEFRMLSMVFVKSGGATGFLGYHLQDMTYSYDGSSKHLFAHFSVWYGAAVIDPRNVLLVDHVAFDGYIRGGDGSLVRSIWTAGKIGHPDEYDFNAEHPGERKAHRFVLYAGASYQDRDVPDPLPLTGSYNKSNFTLGVFVNIGDPARNSRVVRSGPAYPSALLVNHKTGFYRLSAANPYASGTDITFEDRKQMCSTRSNLLLSRANQWGTDANGGYKRKIKKGTGALGNLCEGVGKILNGEPGYIDEIMPQSDK